MPSRGVLPTLYYVHCDFSLTTRFARLTVAAPARPAGRCALLLPRLVHAAAGRIARAAPPTRRCGDGQGPPAVRPPRPEGRQGREDNQTPPCITTGTATTIRHSAATRSPIRWGSSMDRVCLGMRGTIRIGMWIRMGAMLRQSCHGAWRPANAAVCGLTLITIVVIEQCIAETKTRYKFRWKSPPPPDNDNCRPGLCCLTHESTPPDSYGGKMCHYRCGADDRITSTRQSLNMPHVVLGSLTNSIKGFWSDRSGNP